MEWHKQVSGARQVEIHSANADLFAPDAALQQMWQFVRLTLLPLNEAVDWDYLRVEIWHDTGRFIVYPASSHSKYRVEQAGCQVVFPSLLQESEAVDARFQVLDESFEEAISHLELEWIGRCKAAARIELGGSGLELRFCFADEEPLELALCATL